VGTALNELMGIRIEILFLIITMSVLHQATYQVFTINLLFFRCEEGEYLFNTQDVRTNPKYNNLRTQEGQISPPMRGCVTTAFKRYFLVYKDRHNNKDVCSNSPFSAFSY